MGWVQTPSVLAQKVAAFKPVVGDGQRLAAFGHNSIGPAEPGLPATPHQPDLIVNMPFGYWA